MFTRGGILYNELPRTFQDAVDVCRGIGVRYLWIDALCIIQGEDGDFVVEASRMALVYAGSFLTIAAATGTDCTTGLFSRRKQWHHNMIQAGDGFSYVIANSTLDQPNKPGRCYLDSRAWVLQERLMSPRTIYFGPDNIFWECRQNTRYEFCVSDEEHHGKPSSTRETAHLKQTYTVIADTEDSSCTENELHFQWHTIRRIYTPMALSYNTDRLAALAGIASVMEKKLQNGESTYGLWCQWLPRELLWHRAKDSKAPLHTVAKRDLNLAPSWSWVSVLGVEITSERTVNMSVENREFQIAHAEVISYPRWAHFNQDLARAGIHDEPSIITIKCLVTEVYLVPEQHYDGIPLLLLEKKEQLRPSRPNSVWRGIRATCILDIPVSSPNDIDAINDPDDPIICVLIRRSAQQHGSVDPVEGTFVVLGRQYNDEGLVLKRSRKYPGKYERLGYYYDFDEWDQEEAKVIWRDLELGKRLSLREARCKKSFIFPPGMREEVIEII